MIIMASSILQLKNKLYTHETNMPLEFIFKVAAQKEMKMKFDVGIFWYESFMRTDCNSIN